LNQTNDDIEKKILCVDSIYRGWLENDIVIFENENINVDKKKMVLNSVKIGSNFYCALTEKMLRNKMDFEFVVDFEELYYSYDLIKKEIEKGVDFVFIISCKIKAVLLRRLSELVDHKEQFKFVIIARKDWNYENTYKSFPSFYSEQLFIDFPISLHDRDMFYTQYEIECLKNKNEKQNIHVKLKSYEPQLQIMTQEISPLLSDIIFQNNERKGSKNIHIDLMPHNNLTRAYYEKQDFGNTLVTIFRMEGLGALNTFFSVLYTTFQFFNEKIKRSCGIMLNFLSRFILITFLIRFYKKIKFIVKINLWRLSPSYLGWILFKLMFPLRKLFYFVRYQYQKRILGKYKVEGEF
jgi:hypothetical protein